MAHDQLALKPVGAGLCRVLSFCVVDLFNVSNLKFGTFFVDQFGQSMKDLNFIYEGPGIDVLVSLPQKNVKLYYLAFFSKSKLGSTVTTR